MTIKRKSPIKHVVKSHSRNHKIVRSFTRGSHLSKIPHQTNMLKKPVKVSEAPKDSKYITDTKPFTQDGIETTAKQVVGYNSIENSFEQDGYPYGRYRTKIRHWIEYKPSSGERWLSQTMDPKTGKWNKPRASTYSDVILLKLVKQEDGRDFVVRDDIPNWISSVKGDVKRHATKEDIYAWMDNNVLSDRQKKDIVINMKINGLLR